MGIDDNGDGTADNGAGLTDNDENGSLGTPPNAPKTGADWIDPVVYRVSGGQLLERLPNLNPTSGADYTERPIAEWRPFDLERICNTNFEIHHFQPIYYVLESFEQLRDAMNKYAEQVRGASALESVAAR